MGLHRFSSRLFLSPSGSRLLFPLFFQMSPALRTTTHFFFQETLSLRPLHLNSVVLLFLSAAVHTVWFQTPITHKYHVVGVGFGRIASAIQDSGGGGKVPCEVAFSATIRRANVSLMPLLYKTEVRAEGKGLRAAPPSALRATTNILPNRVATREEEGPGSRLARDGGAFGAIDPFHPCWKVALRGLFLTIYG